MLARVRRMAGAVARRAAASLRFRRTEPSPADIDFSMPHVARNPFPYYETLRSHGSVHYLPRHLAWIVLGYDEVQSALVLPGVFSNAPYSGVDSVLLSADPPDHAAIRRVVMPLFASAAVDRLAAFAGEFASSLIRPGMDAVSGYGKPLSEAVACQLLGMSEESLAAIHDAQRASTELASFAAALDRVAPGTAVFSRLVGDGLTPGEAASLVRLLWLAATTTTERAIAHCVLRLLLDRSVRAQVLENRALIPAFVDEVLRLHPPELMLPRLAREDAILGGVRIPAGSLVHLCVGAANRDPARFENPASLLLRPRGTRHFTFGGGIHHCVGATLGRRVLDAAVSALLARAPQFTTAQALDDVVGWCTMTASPVARLTIEIPDGVTGGVSV